MAFGELKAHMDPRKQRIEAVFDQAVELKSPGERAAYLSQACGEDPQLRQEIEELLQAHERAGGFLAATLSEGAPLPLTDSRASPSEKPGDYIGRYKLLEKIGEGGFGVVYLAEQKEPVKRRVALKVIKLGMDTKQVVARFEAERQALALMDHPNIAKIYEAGATDSPLTSDADSAPSPPNQGGEGRGEEVRLVGSQVAPLPNPLLAPPSRREGEEARPVGPVQGEGAAHLAASAESQIEYRKSRIIAGRPYFVMELVRGVPITQYCDENQLSPEERLQLFLQVCEAVQHAHQKGIIHRDLKPSNILVTVNDGQAVPKVIDFGIAKATQQELTEKTIVTQFHQFIGTPAYISPEQAQMSSLDIDTRSDIYALGVLLYELLTGKTPFDGKELLASGLDAMRQTIREKEPPKPSTRLTDFVAADVKRLSSKSEIRNPKSEIDGASLRRLLQEKEKLITLLRGDLDWIVMKCLEKDRNRRYETANGLASDIKRHLDNEPVVARPPSAAYRFQKLVRRNRTASLAVAFVTLAVLLGAVVSTWALLRERAARIREQAALKQANQRLDAALAFVDKVFNKVLPEIENLAGAATAQETLGQAGLDFVQRLREAAADDPALRVWLARLLHHMSEMQSPSNANTVGDYEAGLKRAQQACELLSTGSLPLSPAERLNLLIEVKWDTMQCLNGLGRWDEGVAAAQNLQPLLDQLERFPENSRWARRQRMSTRGDAGYFTILAGRPKEAIERFLLPILNSDWGRNITNTSEWYELEVLMNANDNMATAYGLLKQFEAMIPHADESVRIAELLVQRFPTHAKWAVSRAECMASQGHAMMLTGRGNDGLAALRKGREEIEGLVGKDAANDQFRQARANIAAAQALAFADWSAELSALVPQRRHRLAQAETYLLEAEQFCRAAKAKEPQVWRDVARAELATAKAKLQADENAQSKP